MTDTERYGFEQTLMYGQFRTRQLQKYAKDQAARLRREAKEQKKSEGDDDNDLRSYQDTQLGKIKRLIHRMKPCWIHLGSDWVFLFMLGLVMALISFVLDLAIDKCQTAHIWLYGLSSNVLVQYFVWILFPLVLVAFSVGFTHLVSPHAIGSGIPEMKVILRGTVLSRYLSLKTLIAKIVGLLTALGSGIPIGKEGPFVHIASMVARSMGKFVGSFKGIFTNESRNTEMLAAACAVGVSSCFGSPIGGVLFSIEVTSTYFAVRNYWRGFYSAVCGAFVFRLLAVFVNDEETITALFKTNFRVDFPFDVEEFIAFALIGVACGFGGALFVYTHRKIVNLMRHHRKTKVAKFLQMNRFIYPAIVTFVIATITFPQGLGQFMAGQLTQKQALDELFSNTTWSGTKPKDAADIEVLKHWDGASTNIYVTLVIFIVLKFLMTAVAIALPIPAGVFFPVFLIGAAFGRLAGEAMATWFPNGIRDGDIVSPVVPGGYAVVGAAAMSGAVTHTISTSVIVFELTGQIVHILPVMVAVLIANAIAQWLQPSFYDSIIQIKSLPYLPDLTKTGVYNIMVADIMKTNLFYITYQSTYAELKQLLEVSDHRSYPLVDAPDSMILLGSIQRPQLISLLNQHLNKSLQVSSRAESEDAICSRPESPDSASSLVNDESRKESPAVLEVEAQVSVPKSESNTKLNKSSILEKIPVPQRLHKLFGSGTNMSDVERVAENKDSDVQTADQQAQWEREILQKPIDFNTCKIDPAPFQLVERTSLLKVHKLFALLNLSHAYVTTLGRLAGLVSLREVRQAIEGEKYIDTADVNASSPDPLEFNEFSSETPQGVMLESRPQSANNVPHEESPKL